MASLPPFAVGSPSGTQLDPLQEMMFRQWVQQNKVPFNPNGPVTDYDMRGFYRGMAQGNPMATSGMNPNDNQMHFTDYYKTPAHQSFSTESQFAGPNAGQWVNDYQLASPSGRVLFDEKKEQDARSLAANPDISALAKALMGSR